MPSFESSNAAQLQAGSSISEKRRKKNTSPSPNAMDNHALAAALPVVVSQSAELSASGFFDPLSVIHSPTLPPPTPARQATRVQEQMGFVLHRYPYRETSLIIEGFSRIYGRVALIAKGAKRPHSALRSVLQHFQPLSFSWSGKSEVRTLTRAEWVGGMHPLDGNALLCGFYLNELLIRFCAREDACPKLFDHYVLTLQRLTQPSASAAPILRSFEHALLREMGYLAELDRVANTHERVIPEARYIFDPEHGTRLAQMEDPTLCPSVDGQTLLDMEQDDYQRPITRTQSKRLLRFLLDHHLGGESLKTRRMLSDLHTL